MDIYSKITVAINLNELLLLKLQEKEDQEHKSSSQHVKWTLPMKVTMILVFLCL